MLERDFSYPQRKKDCQNDSPSALIVRLQAFPFYNLILTFLARYEESPELVPIVSCNHELTPTVHVRFTCNPHKPSPLLETVANPVRKCYDGVGKTLSQSDHLRQKYILKAGTLGI